MNITTIYFSATYTTKKIATILTDEIARLLGCTATKKDITNLNDFSGTTPGKDDIVIAAMPVYAGRIPEKGAQALRSIKGNGNKAILVAVYGNREYDDALVEMQDIAEACNLNVIAAAAFIAQHSIFPKTAAGRPDASDIEAIKGFARECAQMVLSGKELSGINIKGNRPYKIPGSIPLKVKTNSRCTECGTCSKLCPAGAIPPDNPKITEHERCIHCGRCINICPRKARSFGGLLYAIASYKFNKKNKARREPEFFFAK